MDPLPDRSLDMPLSTAQSPGWNLARTMMTIVVLIETAQGYSVIPLDEFDGDPSCIVCERSEERRVGKECVSTCRSRWSPENEKKNKTHERKTDIVYRPIKQNTSLS